MTLYQKGVHSSGDLIPAVNLWADKAVLARLKSSSPVASL